MSTPYTVTGTLSDPRTVILDTPVPLPAHRVRVIVEPLLAPPASEGLPGKLRAIRQALRASGHRFRTQEEVDAQIQAERASWEDSRAHLP